MFVGRIDLLDSRDAYYSCYVFVIVHLVVFVFLMFFYLDHVCVCAFLLVSCFFFFKHKTAYDWRFSDWSSDVCSSDLGGSAVRPAVLALRPDVLPRALSRFRQSAQDAARWRAARHRDMGAHRRKSLAAQRHVHHRRAYRPAGPGTARARTVRARRA